MPLFGCVYPMCFRGCVSFWFLSGARPHPPRLPPSVMVEALPRGAWGCKGNTANQRPSTHAQAVRGAPLSLKRGSNPPIKATKPPKGGRRCGAVVRSTVRHHRPQGRRQISHRGTQRKVGGKMSKRVQYYINLATGEITESHTEACEWYRGGDDVAIELNGVIRCTWVH